jgi:hypothetical protein
MNALIPLRAGWPEKGSHSFDIVYAEREKLVLLAIQGERALLIFQSS